MTSSGRIIVGQKHVLPFDDGGERFSVSFDTGSRYFSDCVTIRANESDDSTLYVQFPHVRWLASTLAELADLLEAQGIEAGTATTEGRGPKDESPVGEQPMRPNPVGDNGESEK